MADSVVERPAYLLTKRGLYYRPNSLGYTGIKDKAGRYYASDARPDSGVLAIHEDEAPDFSPACFEDYARAHLQDKLTAAAEREAALRAEIERLRNALEPFGVVNGYTHQPIDATIFAGLHANDLRWRFTLGSFRRARAALGSEARG